MAHFKPLVISTISDLAHYDLYIAIHCEEYDRWRESDPQVWLNKGLSDVDYVKAVFKCDDCGATGQKQIRSYDAERESLFMPH